MAKRDLMQPVGVHVDALHEIRKAMRALRRAERRIMTHMRAEKRQRAPMDDSRSAGRTDEHGELSKRPLSAKPNGGRA